MSKTRMGKRVASLLLSLVMMLSLLPTTVYATEDTGGGTGATYSVDDTSALANTEETVSCEDGQHIWTSSTTTGISVCSKCQTTKAIPDIQAVVPAGGVPEGYTLWTPGYTVLYGNKCENDYTIDEAEKEFIVSRYKYNENGAYIYFTAKVTVDGVEYQTVLDSGDSYLADFNGNGNVRCFYYLEDGVIVRNLKDRSTTPSQAWVSVSTAYAGSVDLNDNDAAYFVEDVGFVTSLNDVTADRVIVYECNTRPQSLTLCGLTYGIGGWCDVVIDPNGGSFAGHTEAYTAVSGMSGRQTVSGEPVREGYGFAGWAISFTPVENVVTFTAQWADAGSGVITTGPVDEEGIIKVGVTGVPHDDDTEIRIDARADGSSALKTVIDVDQQTLRAEHRDVTIKTNVGTLVIDAAAWASMAAKAEDGSHADLSIERSDDGKKYIITAMDGSNNIYPAGSNGSVKISVPYEGINPVVYYVDGTTKTDMKATYENGVLTWVTNHFSEFVIEEASTAYVTVNGVGYDTLKEAIRAANAGDTVTLLADVNLDSAQTISKQLTLDLNGKTISSTAYRTIQLNAGADLTVKDSASGGKITNTYTGKAYPATIYLNAAGTKFTLEGGTIESDPNVTSLQSVAINSEKGKACEVNIKGGSVIVPEAATEGRGIVASTNSMTLKISGGTITGGLHGVDAYSGSTVNITGGEITAHYVDTGVIKEAYGMRLTGTANVTVAGGTITGVKMNDNGNDLPKVTLASGRVNGSFYSIVTSYKPQPEFTVAENATIVLGNDSAAKFLPDTVKLVQNSDGTYGVKAGAYVAQIGETTYETLEAAFAHAKDGDTITLLTDCSGNGIVVEKEKFTDKGLIVDFNNHTYTVGGVLVGSSGTKSNGFQLNKDNKITFRNGAIYGDASVAGDDTTNWTGAPAILIQNYCDLTLSGMKVSGGSNTVYTMSNNCGNVVIENTTINAGGGGSGRAPFALDACGYGSYTGVSVTVKGTSAINGDIEVSRSASNENAVKLALEGGTVTGELKIDSSIKSGDATTVTKGADVTLDAPTGYMWNDANTLVKAVAEVNGTQYETLQAAIDKAGKEATVTLLADTRENVTIDKGLTLDLNGFTLNGGTEKGKPALTITARPVTIKDSSEAQTGTIKREDTAENSGVSSHYVIDVQGNGWLTFEGGNVKNGSGVVGVTGASLVRVGDDSVKKYPGLVINGGTFTQDNFIVIKVDRGYLTLNGGTLNSANTYAVENWFRATIKGGTVNGAVSSWTYSAGSNSTLTIEGGTVNGAVTSVNYGDADKVAKVEITGGTVNGELDTRSYDPKTNELTSIDDAAKATIKVTGGTFDRDPGKYVVEGSTATKNSEGKYGVEKAYLATVGETSYYTMEEAFKAQTASGEPIVMLRDYTTGGTFNSGSINRTVDLDGHTWTYTGTDTNDAAFEINYSDVTLTVKNGTVVSNSMVGLIPSAMGGTITYDNSGLVFEDVTMTANGHSGIETNGNNTNDTVTLKNSTLNVPNGFGIYFPSSGTLTIDNSQITAKTMGVQVCSGSLNINAGSGITVTGDEVPKTENDGAIQDGAAISIVNRTGYKGLDKIEVTGGKFTAKTGNDAIKAYNWNNTNRTEDEWAEAGTYIAVSGGTFSSAVKEEYCATGYIPTTNSDGTHGVKAGTYVAEVGSTKYESLADAFAAVRDNETVKLLANINLSKMLTISGSKAFTLDLNGHNIINKELTALMLAGSTNMTVQDTSETASGMLSGGYIGIVVAAEATLTVKSGVVKGDVSAVMNSGTVNIEDTAKLQRNTGYSVDCEPGSTVNMTGGTVFDIGTTESAHSYNVNVSDGVVENYVYATSVTGGTIKDLILIKGGEISNATINGYIQWLDETVPTLKNVKIGDNATVKNEGYRFNSGKTAIEAIPYVAEYNGAKYTSLQEAIDAASKQNYGQTEVKLLCNLTITETIVFAKQYSVGSVLLNLGGYTLTGNDCRALQINKGNLYLENGTVTSIGDNIVNSSSVIRIGSNEAECSGISPMLYMRNGAKVLAPKTYGVTLFGSATVKEKLTVAGNASIVATGPSPAISGNGDKAYHVDGKGTEITITGNAVVSAENNYAIYHPDNGTLKIQDSATVSGKGGIQMCSGTLTISGSPKIEALGKADHETGAAGPIYDVAAISVVNRSYPGGAPVVTITGTPTVTAVDGEVIHAYTWSSNAESVWAEAGNNINVSGGTYSKTFNTAYLAADCTLVANNDTTYTVKQKPVAEYNGTQYTSLPQAILDANNSEAGGTVKLLDNVTLTRNLGIGGSAPVTLDLDKKTLTLNGAQIYTQGSATVTINNGTIKRIDTPTSGSANNFAIQVMSGSSLTLGAGIGSTYKVTLESTYGIYNVGGTLTVRYATITTNGWSIAVSDSASKTGEVYIGRGMGGNTKTVITSESGNVLGTMVNSKPNVTIDYGTLTSNGTDWDAGVIYWASEGTLTITGGIFNAGSVEGSTAAAVYQKNGTVKISGTTAKLLGSNALIVKAGDGSTGTMVTELSGGTYSTKPEETWVVEGKEIHKTTDGLYKVEGPYVVEVTFEDGTVHKFDSWSKAFYSAEAQGHNATVKLLTDIETTSKVTTWATVTVDFNGHTLTVNGSGVAAITALTKGTAASVTLMDSVGNGGMKTTGVYGVTVRGTGATATVKSGNYNCETTAVQVENGTAYIEGGTFQTVDTDKSYLLNCIDEAFKAGTAKMEVTGGTFYGFDPSANPEGEGTTYVKTGYVSTNNGDGTFTVEEAKYVIKVTSCIEGTDQTVATPTGGGMYCEGEKVTVATNAVAGFKFLGWYDGATLLDTHMTYEHTVTGDCTLIAKYTAVSGGTFRLEVNASKFTVDEKTKMRYVDMRINAATEVVVEYTGNDKFLYWINGSNNVVSTEAKIALVAVGNFKLTAVVESTELGSDYAYVIFKNAFVKGQSLSADYYTSSDTIVFPSTPVYVGRTFKYWGTEVNGEIVEATQAVISDLIKNGATTVIIAPVYESNGTYTVKVNYVDTKGNSLKDTLTISGIGTGLMQYVTADEKIDELTFSHWEIGGKNVGTNKTYAALSRTNGDVVALTAVYVTEGTVTKPENVLTIAATGANIEGGKYKLTFTANYSIDENATIKKGGILFSNKDIAEDIFTINNTSLMCTEWDGDIAQSGARNGVINYSKETTRIYARAYITLADGTVIYSDIVNATYSEIVKK